MKKADPWAWRRLDEARANYTLDPEYVNAPVLTALVNVCSAVGIFVGAFTAIILAYQWHNGVADYWPLVLILALDAVINVGVRLVRRRRRPEPPPRARRVSG
jgi:hypothetical protein